MIIKYVYKRTKSLNCIKVCEKDEFEMWKKIDTESGHKIKITEFGYICYIDY